MCKESWFRFPAGARVVSPKGFEAVLGPMQPRDQLVPGILFPGVEGDVKAAGDLNPTIRLHLVSMLIINGAIPPLYRKLYLIQDLPPLSKCYAPELGFKTS